MRMVCDGTTPWGWDFEAAESPFLNPALMQLGPIGTG